MQAGWPPCTPDQSCGKKSKKENMENIFLRLVVVAALGFWGSGLWSSGLWWVKKWDVSLLFALLVGERLLIEAQHHNNGIHTEIEIGRDNNPLNISLSFFCEFFLSNSSSNEEKISRISPYELIFEVLVSTFHSVILPFHNLLFFKSLKRGLKLS